MFFYKWTVNWKFVPEDIFLSKQFAMALLATQLILLGVFAYSRWRHLPWGLGKLAPKSNLSADRLLIVYYSLTASRYTSRSVYLELHWYRVLPHLALSVLRVVLPHFALSATYGTLCSMAKVIINNQSVLTPFQGYNSGSAGRNVGNFPIQFLQLSDFVLCTLTCTWRSSFLLYLGKTKN